MTWRARAEPVGFEPTHPHGRQFSRLVQYQLCDGSKDAQHCLLEHRRRVLIIPPAPGFELRSPAAILARLGGQLLVRVRGSHFPASAEPTVLASAFGGRRVLADASPQIRARTLLVISLKSGRPDLNRGPLRPERSALPD